MRVLVRIYVRSDWPERWPWWLRWTGYRINKVIYFHKFLPSQMECFWPKFLKYRDNCADPKYEYKDVPPLCDPSMWYLEKMTDPILSGKNYHRCVSDFGAPFLRAIKMWSSIRSCKMLRHRIRLDGPKAGEWSLLLCWTLLRYYWWPLSMCWLCWLQNNCRK